MNSKQIMKRITMIGFCVGCLCLYVPAKGQTFFSGNSASSMSASDKFSGGAYIGSVSLDGKNYQQIGLNADIPLGKFGFGMCLEFNIDADGNIRKQDWDEWQDYLDKFWYIRYGFKGDPFYARLGGLNYTFLGYNSIVNGYSNMVQYPDIKRYGLEGSFKTERLEGEYFLNDFKELIPGNSDRKSSAVLGARVAFKPLWKFSVGVSFVTDLNQYNGLKDSDGDAYPDVFDDYVYDKHYHSEYDRYVAALGGDANAIESADALVDQGLITHRNNISVANMSQSVSIAGVDLGFPVFDFKHFKLDVFSDVSVIFGRGWGMSLPGVRAQFFKNVVNFSASYRIQSKEFIFGYFDQTYEINRAVVFNNNIITKYDQLKSITSDMQGVYVALDADFFGMGGASARYMDMWGNQSLRKQSLYGEAFVTKKLLPFFSQARVFYAQNNVDKISSLKSPNALAGAVLEYATGGMTFGLNWRISFQDKNGDGRISGSAETIKTFGVSAGMKF